jgi:hypothetical protein
VGGFGNPEKHERKQPEMGAGKAPHVGVLNQRITVRSGKQGQPCFLFFASSTPIVQQCEIFRPVYYSKLRLCLLKIIGK